MKQTRRRRTTLARALTGIFAPAHVVILLPLTVGGVTSGWAGIGWGLLAGVLCGWIPATVIHVGVRAGRFTDRHVREREQRPWLIGVIVALVVAALALLLLLDAPHVMVVTVAVMLATLAIIGPVTTVWKISFHTAVAFGAVVVLAQLWPAVPMYGIGAAVTALIGWSRVRLGDHTLAQVVAGALAGGTAAWLTIRWLGWS
ncbi:phosphatase PAP2 family protein [Thermostaphylospora chromogena]|uniref:PAP2 superfamily protein n=1 Tax=Thermostaphylospora chromogena TaxID=35622 RepID=A0A1H1HAN7_9ACTN|nr:phosphatase PAP2 family protein [Thermostaphylospora chromogena]SDR22188.1 PAP2 superfamily protein [Thermostaphylospora chromogena]